MTNPKPIIQFRILEGSNLGDWLASRAERMARGDRNLSDQARTELELWRSVLKAELIRIRRVFTLAEMSCVADVLKSTLLDPTIRAGAGLVFTDAYTEFQGARGISSYGQKWGIDEKALLDKLAALGPAADHALRDALARWWDDQDSGITVESFAKYDLYVTNKKATV